MPRESTVKKALEKESLRAQGGPAFTIADVDTEDNIAPWPGTAPEKEPDPPSRKLKRVLLISLATFGVLSIAGVWIANAYLRANTASIDVRLTLEQKVLVRDGLHHGSTDIIYWRNAYHVIEPAAPAGLGRQETNLLLRRSKDGMTWATAAAFQAGPDRTIRSASFAAISARLMLFAVVVGRAGGESTYMSFTENGNDWSGLEPVFGGAITAPPATRDALTWYCPAYDETSRKTVLLKSAEGGTWDEVAVMHDGGAHQMDIDFLTDGRMIAVGAVSPRTSPFGDAGYTFIATAYPPYTSWETSRASETKIESPRLFQHRGEMYLIAGYAAPFDQNRTRAGNALARSRTALFRVGTDKIERMTDLPSAGDTGGAGVLVQDGAAHFSYHSSDTSRDWPPLLGAILPTEVRLVEIDLASLAGIE